MNILMVGHSRSGKTSFMAGMYRYLGECTEGYGISAKKKNQKEQLSKMAFELSKNKYPDGTNIRNYSAILFSLSPSCHYLIDGGLFG